MALDVITGVLVVLLGLVSAVLFVRGVIGMVAGRDPGEMRYHW